MCHKIRFWARWWFLLLIKLEKCHKNGSLARWHFLRVIKLEKVSSDMFLSSMTVCTHHQAWKSVIKYVLELGDGLYSSSILKKCHWIRFRDRWWFLLVIKLDKVSWTMFSARWQFFNVVKLLNVSSNMCFELDDGFQHVSN